MKFSEQWLRQWVNPSLSTAELVEQMAMLGLTVDFFSPVAETFSHVVIGEVVSTHQHPNADKLTCCEVNIGEKTPLKIVCGAANVRPRIKVAVAKINAVLPGDFKIKEAKLRGEISQGMLCSAKELRLQLGQSVSEGIIELPMDANIGEDFGTYFKANDYSIDVDITPNRGDCLSIRGLARDIAAANQLRLKTPVMKAVRSTVSGTLPLSIDAKTECPRYVGRIIRDVNNTVETPSWMQHIMQRAGIRLINPVVDICNYVMLELGQPMHAFDLTTINHKIHVRHAKANETLTLLDERTITLSTKDLVIADDEKVLALAGIMGGVASSVTSKTSDIFLEAAFFQPKTICLSKRRHATNSDSSYRFERGVDFTIAAEAIERATTLIVSVAGGKPAKTIDVVFPKHLPARDPILLKRDDITRILGITLTDKKVEKILHSLHMTVKSNKSGWKVVPPSFRFDMTLSIDLIEEVARMVGYNTIAPAPLSAHLSMHPKKEARLCDSRVRQFLVDRGYHEAVTYSFIEPAMHQLFSPGITPMTLKNPLSQDMSVMRISLWPGMAQAIQFNLRHQCDRVRLFEMGMCFEPQDAAKDDDILQSNKLAIAMTGSPLTEQWSDKKTAADFYDLKADLMSLLSLSGKASHYQWKPERNPALHPGRSVALYYDDKRIGWLGELHPQILTYLDIRQAVIVCEVDLKTIQDSRLPLYRSFSKFPSVRRDLAILVDSTTDVGIIESVIRKKAGPHLQNVVIFDVYQGKGVPTDKKSIALGLTFQDASRTLVDEEINEVIQGVVIELEKELNATLRT